jgi:hypothetical protein
MEKRVDPKKGQIPIRPDRVKVAYFLKYFGAKFFWLLRIQSFVIFPS